MGQKRKKIEPEKWTNELALDNEFEWQKLLLMATTCNVNARITLFNYYILQRTLVTNRKSYLFKLVEPQSCNSCTGKETITHFIYDCQTTRRIWTVLEGWINHNLNGKLSEENNLTYLKWMHTYRGRRLIAPSDLKRIGDIEPCLL